VPRGATARLFVAIDPPARVRESLCAWAREAVAPARGRASGLEAGSGWGKVSGVSRPLRLLAPELLHVTICFLGSRPVEEIEAIAETMGECATAVGELSVGAPLWLPPRRPRALAVELHEPAGELERLHDAVGLALAVEQARHRRFRPHVTLARMREGAAPRARELPPTPALAFTPRELVLYRSWLSPEGAEYEAVGSATLACPPPWGVPA
jgi:RNA 2',3'-cyclic 3'-phosphodiesterase